MRIFKHPPDPARAAMLLEKAKVIKPEGESKEEGEKHDDGKAPIGLIPPWALWEVAKVLQHGAKEYSPWNWAKGMSWSRVYNAAQRHLLKWQMRESPDKDSGLSHLAHAACCLMFLITYELKGIGRDDRPNI
jgi:hypothetical protein